jgi:L-asparagine oxygenase
VAVPITLAKSVATTGFAVVSRFAVGSASIEAARRLGQVDSVEGLDPVQALIPHSLNDAPPNTYSGNFGRSDFPLHTDLAHWSRPPRYIALRCIRGAPHVATRVLDGQALVANVGADMLRMALVQPRRPMRNGKQLLRLLERSESLSCDLIRWDSLYLRPASHTGASVCRQIHDLLSRLKSIEVTLLELGDTLILDNWRCLHGRSPATEDAGARRVDRVYLRSLDDGKGNGEGEERR